MRIFLENPEIFYSFAKELYPTEEGHQPTNTADGSLAGGKKAGKVHHWIRNLEKQGKLLRNYTQNIDTLEMIAGIHNVLHAHGRSIDMHWTGQIRLTARVRLLCDVFLRQV